MLFTSYIDGMDLKVQFKSRVIEFNSFTASMVRISNGSMGQNADDRKTVRLKSVAEKVSNTRFIIRNS